MLGWKVEYMAAMVVAQGSRYVPERGVTEPVGHMSRAAHGIQVGRYNSVVSEDRTYGAAFVGRGGEICPRLGHNFANKGRNFVSSRSNYVKQN